MARPRGPLGRRRSHALTGWWSAQPARRADRRRQRCSRRTGIGIRGASPRGGGGTAVSGPPSSTAPTARRGRSALAAPPFVPKGPGIKGGGVAAVGAGVGLVATIAVAVAYAIGAPGPLDVNDPWYLLASQLALWVGFVGAVVVASHMNGTGSLTADYGLSWPRSRTYGWASSARGGPHPAADRAGLHRRGRVWFRQPQCRLPEDPGGHPVGHGGLGGRGLVGGGRSPPRRGALLSRAAPGGVHPQNRGRPGPLRHSDHLLVCPCAQRGTPGPLVLFPMALVLGYLRYRTGRLPAGMVAHALFNASVFLLFLIPAFR